VANGVVFLVASILGIVGYIVNFAQKFHSNVIRAVWNADNSEIVVHPVSYMSLTVTLN
jgi:hypothetical protein